MRPWAVRIDKDALEEDDMKMYMRIDGPAEALHKGDRAGLHGGPRGALLDRVRDIILGDGAADDRMDAGGERSGGRYPVPQRHGHRDHPLPRGHPGDDLLDEMGGLLRHAPPRTGGAKAAFLTAGRQEHLVRTGVTVQADKAVGQDAVLQGGVKFVNDRRGEACGGGIGRDGGQKGLQVCGNDLVEGGLARIVWHIRRRGSFQRWCHRYIGVLSNGLIVITIANNCSYAHCIRLHIQVQL
jgi:hypothetical protein